jgi:hypothetical protein
MKDKHIINLLEGGPLGSLSDSEQALIRDHISECGECRRAHQAARISGRLLAERVAVAIEPSPFFQTRVLAALREQQMSSELSAIGRMWRSARWLVSSMTAAVVLLIALTLFTASTQPPSNTLDLASALSPDSAEQVIFVPDDLPDDEITYSQVFTALYEPENNSGGNYEPRR